MFAFPNEQNANRWPVDSSEKHELPEARVSNGNSPSQRGPVIVTGLPRSGTSMVMQMLNAGGMPLLIDEGRPADDHNPRGYYEFEPVKRIETDTSWLPQAYGKAVKIVIPLVRVIAGMDVHATVLLVMRDLNAVLASQKRMIEADGGVVPPDEQDQLRVVFQTEQAQARALLNANRHQKLVVLTYEAILENPLREANRIAQALPACVDAAAMAAVVDLTLNRSGS